jgi:hypothetical protein
VSGLVLGLVGAGILFTLPHWWIRVGFAEAKGPGEVESEASVYRSTSGDVLFLVPDDSFVDCYVFTPATSEITIPSCGSQIHSFGVVVFSNESPIPGVQSSNKIKVETDMNILINENEIAFTTLSGSRIKAKRDSF